MKNFIKNIFSTMIALFLTGILFIVLAFIFIIAIGSSNSSKDIKIEPNSILTLNLKNKIVDYDTEIQTSVLDYNQSGELRHHDIIRAISAAKNDENIKGISIETDDIDAGQTQVDEIRAALEDFKKSRKFVHSYGNTVSQNAYYLGSVAHQYFLNPVGSIELKGLSSEIAFFKDFAEKYGINMNVIRHGKFKAAVEPFLRNDISPENKEQTATLLNDIWGDISQKIIQSRQLNPTEFQNIVDNLYGIIPDLGLKHKLVDKLSQKSEYENFLKTLLNIDKDSQLNKVSINQYINHLTDESLHSDKIAVLYAAGTIYNGNKPFDIHSEKYIQYIKDLANDDQIKAVVLRVNSPGGSANASDEILFELQQLKQKKPLIVSFGDYAASGGYYIAMAADRIFAQNSTITGSIGVFGMLPDAKNLANKNGIHTEIVTTNANSQMHSPISGVSNGTLEIIQKSVEATYKRFIYFVSQNRKMTPEKVNELGEGRVWSGKKAKELGLIDEIGSLDDAIKYAAKRANITEYQVENYPEKMDKFSMLISNFEEENILTPFIKDKIGKEYYPFFQILSNPEQKNQLQMILPFSLRIK